MSTEEQAEEQEMELEALDSIFGADFADISEGAEGDGAAGRRYRIALQPHSGESAEPNHVALNLICIIPPAYPDEAPAFELELLQGLGATDEQEILRLCGEMAEDNAGMAMIYTIAEGVREWLQENNNPGHDGSMHSEMIRRQQLKEKQESNAKREEDMRQARDEIARGGGAAAGGGGSGGGPTRGVDPEGESSGLYEVRHTTADGTAVTAESFAAWAEANQARIFATQETSLPDTVFVGLGNLSKPSGKAMWMADTEALAAGEEAAVHQQQSAEDEKVGEDEADAAAVVVQESLFDGEDDDDDDLLDDDDDDDLEDDEDDAVDAVDGIAAGEGT